MCCAVHQFNFNYKLNWIQIAQLSRQGPIALIIRGIRDRLVAFQRAQHPLALLCLAAQPQSQVMKLLDRFAMTDRHPCLACLGHSEIHEIFIPAVVCCSGLTPDQQFTHNRLKGPRTSSKITNLGFWTSTRAMPILCCSPTLSWSSHRRVASRPPSTRSSRCPRDTFHHIFPSQQTRRPQHRSGNLLC